METRYLREFLVLLETLSFSEAANRLYISQSTLSKHIQALEEDLGAELFYRNKRHVELTKYGEIIQPAIHAIISAEESINRSIQFISDNNQITVGIAPSMSHDKFYKALINTNFALEKNKVQLKVVVDDTNNLLNSLRAGNCDYAFLRSTEGESRFDREFVTIPYKTEQLRVMLPASHPLAQKEEVEFRELRSENFLLLQPSSFSTKLCEAECSKAGFVPRSVFQSHTSSFIRQFVAKGKGISISSGIVSDTLKDQIVYRPITPPVTVYVTLCYNKDRVMVDKDAIFLEFYRNNI